MAQRWTGQTDPTFGAKGFVGVCLVDSVRWYRAEIAAKFALVIPHGSLKITALIEIDLAGRYNRLPRRCAVFVQILWHWDIFPAELARHGAAPD